jgi:replicative DNA helicase
MLNKKIILPNNIIAEKIILGSILTNPDSINFVSQFLTVDSFYLSEHQYIYKAALILNSNKQIVDLITISSWLQDNNLIDRIGGLSTLNNLAGSIVTYINLKEYTELIREKYLRRLLIDLGEEIINLAYQTNFPLQNIFNKIERKFLKLNQKNNDNNLSTTAEILTEIFVNLKKKGTNYSFEGYLSKFYDLDAMTQGFQKSDLIIIAGRPAMGKTAFALNIAKDICLKYNMPVIFFSLEMTKEQLVYRLISIETEIPSIRLKLGHLNEEEWKKIHKSFNELSALPLYIDDTPNISLNDINYKLQQIKSQFGFVGIVIIDYLQLLESLKKTENRAQEISQITRTLKTFAREFNLPIIVLSQLSRNVESRNNKRPVLSDLRESGCFVLLKEQTLLETNLNNQNILTYRLKNFNLIKTSLFRLNFTGIKPIYKLITKFELEISVTANHKLLFLNFWKRFDQIIQKDFLKVNLSFIPNNFYFKSIINDKVKKIKYIGLQKVYDFEVFKFKNFFSNGFILHNSIEQDADIVLMLYRDDYYYENSNEKNIAEIIIAKHRNGPVGTIKLRFDSYLTKFFNYP